MSHSSMLRMIDSLGTVHDAEVKCWKEAITQTLSRTPQVNYEMLQCYSSACEQM